MKILVLANGRIVAIGSLGPIVEHADRVETPIGIFPHDIMPGFQIVDVDLPEGFEIGRYGADWKNGEVVNTEPIVDPAAIEAEKQRMADEIDALVAAVYAGPQRFVVEYQEREAQARAFIYDLSVDPNTPAPPLIAGFATASGMTAEAAAQLTIQQANNLHTARDALANQRMRKYEVKRAASLAAAKERFKAVRNQIEAIAKTLE